MCVCVCLGKVCEAGVYILLTCSHETEAESTSDTLLTGKLNFLRPCHAGGGLIEGRVS